MDSFGAFEQCMIDADPEARHHERKIRRTGLLVAVGAQTALLAALVLVPIMTPAALPRFMALVQIPMFRPPVVVHVVAEDRTDRASPRAYVPNNSIRPSMAMRPDENVDVAPMGDISSPGLGNAAVGDILGRAISSMPPAPVVPREAPTKPLTIGGGVMEAMLVKRIEPLYPKIAEIAHISGPVVLSAIIAADGTIQSLSVVSGNPMLAPAAEAAVRAWRYKPTLLNGQPVEVETLITVNFILN
jgi:periplasmic protein TonB